MTADLTLGEMTTLQLFKVGTGYQPSVSVHFDGTIEFGPDYDPDEASRQFWESVTNYRQTTAAELTVLADTIENTDHGKGPGEDWGLWYAARAIREFRDRREA